MTHTTRTRLFLAAATLMTISACSETHESKPAALAASDKPAANTLAATSVDKPAANALAATFVGKPSAPIHFRYEVMGNPVVGQPVSVNVFVSSSVTDTPIHLYYRVTDASSMLFAESQLLQREVSIAPGDEPGPQQITVVPQREGRLYLNVSAEIQTDNDTMLKTMSIPIQVGAAPPDLQTNGELIETADGETVISMPAEQN